MRLLSSRCMAGGGELLHQHSRLNLQHETIRLWYVFDYYEARELGLRSGQKHGLECLAPMPASWSPLACRDLDSIDDLHFGVHKDMMYALATPSVPGAQWTGIVTQIAIQMLESRQVEAVVCVQSDEHDRFTPKPVRYRDFMTFCRAQVQTAWLFDSKNISQCLALQPLMCAWGSKPHQHLVWLQYNCSCPVYADFCIRIWGVRCAACSTLQGGYPQSKGREANTVSQSQHPCYCGGPGCQAASVYWCGLSGMPCKFLLGIDCISSMSSSV